MTGFILKWLHRKTKNTNLKLRCPDHPTYQAIRRPKATCEACNSLYELEHGEAPYDGTTHVQLPPAEHNEALGLRSHAKSNPENMGFSPIKKSRTIVPHDNNRAMI